MIIPSLSNIGVNKKDIGFVIGTFEESAVLFTNYSIYEEKAINVKRYKRKVK
ncbi:MAG TPA: hypothetical protein GXZ95_01955 [Mollicutes bacterium]|nr:hypothetical protein [Mollicutes bacterium]